ncbi:MAG: PQQ-binding-like beta-propeller repeat protein, partial [Planctomycetaceae bacterium]
MFTLLSVATLSIATSGLRGEDWREFRGPTGQGVTTSQQLPLTWSQTEHVTWKQPIDGVAWSSPVVSEGVIYLTSAIEEPAGHFALVTMARSFETGAELWRTPLFEHDAKVEIHQKNSHASPTPIVAGDRIYVHFGPHGSACLSTAGKVLWKQTLPYRPQHGNGGSPALFQDRLIYCCDGTDVQYVTALDATTGKELWKTPRDTKPDRGFSFSTPLLIEVNGTWQAICP